MRARAAWNLSGGRSTNRGKTGNTCTKQHPCNSELHLRKRCILNKENKPSVPSLRSWVQNSNLFFRQWGKHRYKKGSILFRHHHNKDPGLTESSSMHWHFAFRNYNWAVSNWSLCPLKYEYFQGKHENWSECEPSSIYMVAMKMHSTHAQQVVIGKPGV